MRLEAKHFDSTFVTVTVIFRLTQPIVRLTKLLESLASNEHCLFCPQDLAAAFPYPSLPALHALLSRADDKRRLVRVCQGIYLYPKVACDPSLLLYYHAAAKLRDTQLCYLSLESVLSEAGIISQQPLNWISPMTSGRSGTFDCGELGTIEIIRDNPQLGTLRPALEKELLHFDILREIGVAAFLSDCTFLNAWQ